MAHVIRRPSSRCAHLAILLCVVMFTAAAANEVRGVTTADQPASLLVFPYVTVDAERGVDTVVRLPNASDNVQRVWCAYESHNGHCSADGQVCSDQRPCEQGTCEPGMSTFDFIVELSFQQTLEWRAGTGARS